MVTAKQIKQTRDRMGESHGEFAKRFGISRPALINWEKGNLPKYPPTVEHIERVLADMAFEFARRQRGDS
jgi:DNA-binding XRE family transcriptional regulator